MRKFIRLTPKEHRERAEMLRKTAKPHLRNRAEKLARSDDVLARRKEAREKLRTVGIALLLLYPNWSADAQTTDACNQFAWPVASERSLFAAANLTNVRSGETIKPSSMQAIVLNLKKFDDVQFSRVPERLPQSSDSFAAMLIISSVEKPGLYQLTLSEDAWIDVIQDDAFLKSLGSTGKRGCADVRKSVRFELSSGLVIIQFSGVEADTIKFAILPIEQN
jgi:hypothetical protein